MLFSWSVRRCVAKDVPPDLRELLKRANWLPADSFRRLQAGTLPGTGEMLDDPGIWEYTQLRNTIGRASPDRPPSRGQLPCDIAVRLAGSRPTHARPVGSEWGRPLAGHRRERDPLGVRPVRDFVQEEGKPRGVLMYGVPPPADKLPQVGDEIKVYRNNQDTRSPQYRWDRPEPPRGKQPPQGKGR